MLGVRAKLGAGSRWLAGTVAMAAVLIAAGTASADMAAAKKWVDNEFQPSTLSKEEQLKEMEWFIKAAEAVQGHGDQRRCRRPSRRTSMNRRS